MQSRFSTQARVENLHQVEIPAQLGKLASDVTLQLVPSLQLSRGLASSIFIEDWVKEGAPRSSLQVIEAEMARIQGQLEAGIVFIVANTGEAVYYYLYHEGRLSRRQMHTDDPQDGWYFRYLNSGAAYELNLDTNEFSGSGLKMFVNYSGLSKNARGIPYVVAGVGLDMGQLTEMISQYRLGASGGVSLVNADGQVEVKAAGSRIETLTDAGLQALKARQGVSVIETTYADMPLFVGSVWIDALQRYLLVEVPREEYMLPIRQQLLQSVLLGLVLLLVSLALLYPLVTSLTRPILSFQQQMKQITRTLNLAQRIQVGDRAEVGDLAVQTNHLLERLGHVIQGILSSSKQLNLSANQLAHTAGLVSHQQHLQQQVSQSMAAAVEQMSSSVAEITSTMEELSASSTQIADHSQSVVDVANLTLDNSKKGAQAMQQLVQRMTEIQQDNARSLQEIMELGAKSKQISKVMDLINTLADQTKLIAFNAALEASSAGESGKRFSVVAGEIRRLADSVTDSTLEIEDRIQEIQDSISRLVINSEKGASSIQSGMEVSAVTADDLNALVQAATKTSNAAQQISLSTRQQKTASSQVVIALRDIANASSHNAQSVRNITEISEEMIHMSTELNQLVQEFHLAEAESAKE